MAFKCGIRMSFKQVIKPHIKNSDVNEINAKRFWFGAPKSAVLCCLSTTTEELAIR